MNYLYRIFLRLLEINIPLDSQPELGLSLILVFLMGRHSSSNLFRMFKKCVIRFV